MPFCSDHRFFARKHFSARGTIGIFRYTGLGAGRRLVRRKLFIVLYCKCNLRIFVNIARNDLNTYGEFFLIRRRNGQRAILSQCDAVMLTL